MERSGGVLEQEADYDALYRAHAERVFRLCRLLLADTQEAEEVSQEVFLKLHRECQSARPMAWGPWLTRVTVNACRDRRRSAWWKWRRDASVELEEARAPWDGPTPEQEALGGETRARIWRAFRELSRRQREVFTLRQIEGWSTEEVAAALGLSPGSVKQHLFRAVHRLRNALGDGS